MRFVAPVLVCVGLCACSGKKDRVLITSEVNMAGHRHDLAYRGDTLTQITYSTFITRSDADTSKIDTLIRRDVDSLIYESDNSISLLRTFSRHGKFGSVHRKYRFNSDNLLLTISRYSPTGEYTTDSVAYDYTTRTAHYYDLVNKVVEILEYDRQDNVASIVKHRITNRSTTGAVSQSASSVTPIQITYNYFTNSRDPFLINVSDDQLLFGCFRRSAISLFWNGALRPEFKSAHNIQATKQARNNQESNDLYEYQFRDGLPTARYGGYGAVYYRYRSLE